MQDQGLTARLSLRALLNYAAHRPCRQRLAGSCTPCCSVRESLFIPHTVREGHIACVAAHIIASSRHKALQHIASHSTAQQKGPAPFHYLSLFAHPVLLPPMPSMPRSFSAMTLSSAVRIHSRERPPDAAPATCMPLELIPSSVTGSMMTSKQPPCNGSASFCRPQLLVNCEIDKKA